MTEGLTPGEILFKIKISSDDFLVYLHNLK